MERVGILPEPDAVLSTTIIGLFGILSSTAKTDEECHFCLEKITKGQFCILKLPCCGHQVHTDCFKIWATSPQPKVRCAYCRTKYIYEDNCFLCLNKISDEKISYTNCCHSKIHTKCATELTELVTLLTFEHSLECGQLSNCNCIWVHV